MKEETGNEVDYLIKHTEYINCHCNPVVLWCLKREHNRMTSSLQKFDIQMEVSKQNLANINHTNPTIPIKSKRLLFGIVLRSLQTS
jgi:hypothetical protein